MAIVAVASLLGLASSSSHPCPGPYCGPGNETCGDPFQNAPMFHLMDQHGCGENDPNGPVFDPVHGVFHHFYQIHLAAPPGHGPDYGHFVSKDFVNWAALPVAIWNGLDSSVWPPKVTKYDNEAIFTGSAQVVNGAGPNGAPGVVNIYPGLCNKKDWPACGTGTLLAMAVPAEYESDPLLTNWSKPSFNPIVQNTQRDPSSPWKMPSGEWRFRTYNSMVYGAANDQDYLDGKWYTIGANPDFRQCECPSFYPLPASTPGFEAEYDALKSTGGMPTHVHKTSCGGDWWQIGTYTPAAPKVLSNFTATPGWEDVFAQVSIDPGAFYASKDNLYPTKGSKTMRRVNWGWARVPPASTQTLPREITFNAAARTLQSYPVEEINELQQTAVHTGAVKASGGSVVPLKIASGVVRQSSIMATFDISTLKEPTTFGIVIGDGSPSPNGTKVGTYLPGTDLPGDDFNVTHYPPHTSPKVCEAACNDNARCKAWTYVVRGEPAGSGDCCLKGGVVCPDAKSTCTSGAKTDTVVNCHGNGGTSTACTVAWTPNTNASAPFYEVPVSCGTTQSKLRLLPTEKSVEIRIFNDWTFLEAYFQQGRIAMTHVINTPVDGDYSVTSTGDITATDVSVYPMKAIWTTPEAVRDAPRIYN